MPVAIMQHTPGLKHVLTSLHDAHEAAEGPIIWNPSIDMNIGVPMSEERMAEAAVKAAESGADVAMGQGTWGPTPIDEA